MEDLKEIKWPVIENEFIYIGDENIIDFSDMSDEEITEMFDIKIMKGKGKGDIVLNIRLKTK